jgi:MerR family transcriptional regulator/heat shock protein HspR
MPRTIKIQVTKSSGRYFSLEAVCEILDLSPRRVLLYERRGLIRSLRIETFPGPSRAVYSPAEIRRLRRILLLTKEMGVNLAGVEIILRLLEQLETG